MAPKSIWNGTISFGLAAVPIKLYTATESKSIHFNEVHVSDGARIEHRRVCSKEDKEVPFKEVVKGYEVTEGEFVVLDKDEIAAAAGGRGKVIELEEFVPEGEIDPLFFDKTYYVGSRDETEPYRVFLAALERSGRVGIGRFTFRDREYLAAVRSLDGVLALHTMRFNDEIVHADDLDAPKAGKAPSKREVDMAGKLVDSLERKFKPEDYEDSYRDAVLELIKRKAKGKDLAPDEPEAEEQTPDLSAALEASLGS